MNYARFLVPGVFLAFALSTNANAQEPSQVQKSEIVWARDFLRALYPPLNGKGYGLTVETYLAYDQPGDKINSLRMDVGEGPKDWLEGHSGGCLSSIMPPPPGWPKEMGLPSPTTLPPSPKEERCKQGPIYPKQSLTAGFQFDEEGHLTSFGADGAFINDRKDDNEVYEIVRAHPEMTYAQVVATMKEHGTRYGPDDREQLLKDLPLKQLAPFLGNLQILSVSCPQMDKGPNEVPWVNRWLTPDWTVKAQTTAKDGTKVPYELRFSHLNGYLTGLLDCRTSPWCHKD